MLRALRRAETACRRSYLRNFLRHPFVRRPHATMQYCIGAFAANSIGANNMTIRWRKVAP